jgi:hypothetical protein
MTGCGIGTALPRGIRRLAYAAVRAAVATAAVFVVAGCAEAPPAPAPSASSASPASSAPSIPPVVTVTEVDSSRTVALRPGQRLEVFLHGTAQSLWTPPAVQGSALVPAASGKLTLPVGVTGGAFEAARPGSARITSTRKLCPNAGPGQEACQGIQSFELTVTVA